MYKFIILSRRSKLDKEGNSHTHKTNEWHIKNYLSSLDRQDIPYEIVASYQEDRSGAGYYIDKRPVLREIVKQCKEDKSLTLLVAKADRLTRNARTGTELIESINFILCNSPTADTLQKQLEFVIAEKEAQVIAQRFKDMYQAKRSRSIKNGEKLIWGGNSPKWKESFQENRSLGLHKLNPAHYTPTPEKSNVVENIKKIISISGKKKVEDLIDIVNEQGIVTSTGKEFTKQNLSNFLRRNKLGEWGRF